MAKKNTPQIEEETTLDIIIPVVQEDVPQDSLTSVKSTALALINVTEESLKNIEDTYGQYKVEGDPKRYKEAKEVKNKLVKVRTSTEKLRIAINKQFSEAVNAEAARIVGRTTPVEKHLLLEVETFEQAEEQKRQERINHVSKTLIEAGFHFNGVAYECGDRTIWQTDLETMMDEVLENHRKFAIQFRLDEAEVQAENLRRSAPVYLHQPELNELLTLTRGEFEVEAEALRGNGVVEITKDEYDRIKEAKLSAFRRPAPQTATPTPQEPTPPPPALETRPAREPQEHDVDFAASFKSTPSFPPPSAQPLGEKSLADIEFEAFERGYETFRSQVVATFQNPSIQYKRADWIEFFKNLKYTQKV